MKAEWPYEEMLAKHFFHRGHFMWQTELAEISNMLAIPFWSYMQLKHLLNAPSRRESFTKSTTRLE